MTNPQMKRRYYDFVGVRKYAAIGSAIAMIASICLFIFVGPTWGIDFTGGTEVQVSFKDKMEIKTIRDALDDPSLGLGKDISVQTMDESKSKDFVIRIQDPQAGTSGTKTRIEDTLKKEFGKEWIKTMSVDAEVGARLVVVYTGEKVGFEKIQNSLKGVNGVQKVEPSPDQNTFYVTFPSQIFKIQNAIKQKLSPNFEMPQTDSVGPKVGGELRRQGLISIFFTLALILVYVAFRFNLSFAPGAVLALFHDVTIVVGIFIVLDMAGWTLEFNLPIIGALLTIIGYSLNDTIVIYDRIRENMSRYRRKDLPGLINDSVNETLSRTLATSFTTLVAMMAFLVLGGEVIQTFALAIFLGVIFGTYSTVFVASPMILVMQDVQPYLGRLFAPLSTTTEGEEKGELTETEKRRRTRANLTKD